RRLCGRLAYLARWHPYPVAGVAAQRATATPGGRMAQPVLLETDLPLPRFGIGKVRDTYDLGNRLLMVTTDRLSAFDCVLPNGIPGKGEVLTRLSTFWFDRTKDLIPNHLISTDAADLPEAVQSFRDQLVGRFMIVRKVRRIDFECVVRGYLA